MKQSCRIEYAHMEVWALFVGCVSATCQMNKYSHLELVIIHDFFKMVWRQRYALRLQKIEEATARRVGRDSGHVSSGKGSPRGGQASLQGGLQEWLVVLLINLRQNSL